MIADIQLLENLEDFAIAEWRPIQDLGHTVSILTKDEIITASGVLSVIW